MTYNQVLEALKTAAGNKLNWAVDNHYNTLKLIIKGATERVVLSFQRKEGSYIIFTLICLTSESSNYVYSVNFDMSATASKFLSSTLSYTGGGTAVISISNISATNIPSIFAGTWEITY